MRWEGGRIYYWVFFSKGAKSISGRFWRYYDCIETSFCTVFVFRKYIPQLYLSLNFREHLVPSHVQLLLVLKNYVGDASGHSPHIETLLVFIVQVVLENIFHFQSALFSMRIFSLEHLASKFISEWKLKNNSYLKMLILIVKFRVQMAKKWK